MELKYTDDNHMAHPKKPGRMHPYRHCIVALSCSLKKWVARIELPPKAKIVDYGCSVMQYRDLFPNSCDYQGADLPGNKLASIEICELNFSDFEFY